MIINVQRIWWQQRLLFQKQTLLPYETWQVVLWRAIKEEEEEKYELKESIYRFKGERFLINVGWKKSKKSSITSQGEALIEDVDWSFYTHW